MANILRKWVENDQREVNRIGKIADKVMDHEEEYAALSDEELQAKTPAFKERLANGETLDDIYLKPSPLRVKVLSVCWGSSHSACRSLVGSPCMKVISPK